MPHWQHNTAYAVRQFRAHCNEHDFRVLFGATTKLVPYSCDSPNGLDLRRDVERIVKEYHLAVAEELASIPFQEAKRFVLPKDDERAKALTRAAKRVEADLTRAYEKGVHTGRSSNAGRYPVALDPDEARDWAKKQAGQLIDDITKSDRSRIAKAVKAGIEQGLSAKKVREQIIDTVKDEQITASRAKMIATTEMNIALSRGAMVAALQNGATGKSWIVVRDNHLCLECEANGRDGIIPVGRNFNSGDKITPAHPNCRCFILWDYTRKHRRKDKYQLPKNIVQWEKVKK